MKRPRLPRRIKGLLAENKLLILGVAITLTTLHIQIATMNPDPHIEDALDAVAIVSTSSATGSGFFITDNGCLLTAEHVVRGAKDDTVTITLRGERDVHAGVVMAASAQMDMAIVCSPIRTPNYLRVVDTETLMRGTRVYALGHPVGRTWNVTEGIISRAGYKMHSRNGKTWYPRYDLWVSCFISWGSSGGPVIDERGNVVGMIVEWDDPNIGRPNNMNIATPGTDLLRFIRTTMGK